MEGNYHNFANYLDVVVFTYTGFMGALATCGYLTYGDGVQQILGMSYHSALKQKLDDLLVVALTTVKLFRLLQQENIIIMHKFSIAAQNLPTDDYIVVFINITLVVGVALTYPLQIFPVVQVLENMLFAEGTTDYIVYALIPH